MNILSEFVGVERERYADEDNNLFTFSLEQALRYYEFIVIIADRHKEVSQRFVQNTRKLMETARAGGAGGPMTEDLMRLHEEGRQLSTLVHLEIESFYLFAKTFLDKIALFLRDYFGLAQGKGISLISHHRLTKSHDQYRLEKELVYPDGFSESLTFLQESVCEYRDKQISHLQNPRTMKATMWSGSGQTRIATTQVYPNPSELNKKQVTSKELPDIVNAIDQYIQQVIAVVQSNRAKTRFRLKEQANPTKPS